MSLISWGIYLAELSGYLKNFLIGSSLVFFIISIITIIIYACNYNEHYEERKEYPDKRLDKFKFIIKISVLMFFIGSILPSPLTVYLITGITVSENVIQEVGKSELYKDAIDILKIKIKDIKNEMELEE